MLHDTKQFSFLGIPSQQQYADFIAWEIFLRQTLVMSIVELGTGRGGFSAFLLLWAIQKSATFTTYDIEKKKNNFGSRIENHFRAVGHFRNQDVLADPGAVVKSLAHPTVVFCDNGNKPQEMQIYSKLLKPGDYIAVHDFGVEIQPEDLAGLPIEPIFSDETEGLESITRFYKITGGEKNGG